MTWSQIQSNICKEYHFMPIDYTLLSWWCTMDVIEQPTTNKQHRQLRLAIEYKVKIMRWNARSVSYSIDSECDGLGFEGKWQCRQHSKISMNPNSIHARWWCDNAIALHNFRDFQQIMCDSLRRSFNAPNISMGWEIDYASSKYASFFISIVLYSVP